MYSILDEVHKCVYTNGLDVHLLHVQIYCYELINDIDMTQHKVIYYLSLGIMKYSHFADVAHKSCKVFCMISRLK
jgi:hypothetical protein